jgi:hypothetical protein
MNQKWFSMKPKKQFGPKRIPYNNKSKLVMEYRFTWLQWFVLGGALSWPIATRIGKWSQTTSGGVPAVWYPRFVEDHPNVDPKYSVSKYFKRYSLLTCFVGGFAMATYMTDVGAMGNRDY